MLFALGAALLLASGAMAEKPSAPPAGGPNPPGAGPSRPETGDFGKKMGSEEESPPKPTKPPKAPKAPKTPEA